jgi:hypothetical protein
MTNHGGVPSPTRKPLENSAFLAERMRSLEPVSSTSS